jgi:hypothetical protein
MRPFTLLLIAALCVLTASPVVVAQSPPLTSFRGLIDHVSADQWGNVPTENVEVWHGAISGDGRYVVMSTRNPYLANGEYNDTNGYDDVFLRDRMSGWTWLISRPTFGGSANGTSQMATISTNGRHIAFASGATNLVPGDTNGRWDVFVYDMDQYRLVRVSVATDGTQGDRDAYYPAISADGRFIAFLSWSTTFAPAVSSSSPRQVYLHDRDVAGDGLFDTPGDVSTQLVSADLTGGIANDSADSPRVTSDGRVLFESAATNLSDVGNPNAMNHLYLRDRLTGQTTFIDRAVTGGPSQNGVGYGTSDITDDGRWVTFSSTSPDIHWFDMNGQSQVFRYDTANGPAFTGIVSQLPNNGPLGDGSSYATSGSADGRYVVFTTASSNLASPPPGASGPAMLVVRDMYEDTFARVDVLDSGEPFDQADYYYTAAISADGTAIALQTRSERAVGDIYTWGASHAVVMTALTATPASASYPFGGGSGSIDVNTSAVSGWRASSSSPWIMVTEGGGFGAGPRTVQYVVDANNTGVGRDGWIQVGSKYIPIHQNGTDDTTPPVITPVVNGTPGDNGWYTSDVSVSFSYEDPDSPISSAVGCNLTTQTTDTAGTTFTCTVTSEGGSASGSVTVKRDTTPPSGIIWGPPYAEFLHQKHTLYATDYVCSDSTSGIASCTGPVPDGGWLPTSVAGRFSFDVQARDRAGNTGIISRPYYVSTNVCSPRPPGLVGWWPGDGHSREIIARNDGSFVNGTPIYSSGPYGMGFVYIQSRYLWVPDVPALRMDDAFTLSAWVYQVRDWLGPYAVIAGREGEYLLARGPNGNIHYSIANTNPGWGWVDSGVRMDREKWTKLALSYDGSAIRLYKNGQLAHVRAASGAIGDAAPFHNAFQVAARQSTSEPSYFDGQIDDVQLVDRAMSDAEIDAAYLSGIGGVCALPTTVTFTPALPRATYGGSAELVARLTNEQGQPIQGEQIQFSFRYAAAGTALTDADGVARLPVSIAGLAAQTLTNGAVATHPATAYLQHSTVTSDFIIDRASPVITWNPPAAIVYGAPLSSTQLNATANVAGFFVYSPAAGATLPAGSNTLGVTFTPSSANYTAATSSAPLTVLKATPTVTAIGGTFTYDKQPHAGSGTAKGVFNETLSPVTVTYNGSSSTPPTDAGTHTVRASYAGSANYVAREAETPLTINRATPAVEISSAPVFYTSYPRPAMVTIHGLAGDTLNPFVVGYDGSTTAPTNAGTYALEVQYAGSTNYAPVTATGSFVIRKTTPILGPLNDLGFTYDGQPHGGYAVHIPAVEGGWLTPVIYTYNGTSAQPVNAGVYTAVVRYDGSANYEAVSTTYTLTIFKVVPNFTWWPADPDITYGTALGASQLNATSNVAGSITYTPPAGTVLNAGSHTVTAVFTPADPANHESRSLARTLDVSKANTSVFWSRPANIVYGTPLGVTQLNATATVPGTFVYTPAAGTVLTAGDHVLSVTFTPDDSANYNGRSSGVGFTVSKAAPVVSWNAPADITYGTPLGTAQLNATASVPGTFSYSPAAGTVLGAGAQTLSVTFTPDDAANYNGASANVPLNVARAATTVSWSNPADIVYGTALGGSQLNATANVPGTFSYSPAVGALLNAGSHTLSVTFTPDDAANYDGASANVSVTVTKAASTINWSNPADIVYGTALGGSQLNATANVAGTFSYSPAAGTVIGAGSQTLAVTFTPDDAANYNGSSANVALTVNMAQSTINWSNPADVVYGTALGAAQLNATANVAGTFSYSPAAGTMLGAGSHTLSVTFTPDDAANYNGSSANVSVTVNRAQSAINWSNPADVVYGTALGAAQLNATANVTGTFSYSPAAGAALNAGSHTLSVTFTPDDAANYDGSSANVSVTVTKAASTINWANPVDVVYGTALGGSQLNATANVAGTFTYSPAAGTVLGAGSQTLAVTFTPDDAANYNGSSASVTLNVAKAATSVTWSNPAGIVYGTALGGAQLNATANVAGTFAYSPAAGTVLGAGSQTLTVMFTPDESANYASATANVSIAVGKAAPVITWATPAGITYGTMLSGTQLNATANVNGSFVYTVPAASELGAGPHDLSVTFTPADGANYTTASRSVSIVVSPAALTVSADNAGKVYGQALPPFTATGTGFVNGDSMSSLGGALAFATGATATSAPGSYSVTPSGVSSANYVITFAAGTLTVNKASTSLTLTTTPNPSNNNQTVQLRAVVSAVAPGAGTATGTVEFRENGTLLGTATLVNGVATMNKNFKRGTHPLTATYAGSTNFTGSSGSRTHQTQ